MKIHTKIHKHVKKHLHKFFVPHQHNDYHPHLFRTTSVTFILGLAIFLLGISFGNSIFLTKTVLGVNIVTDVLVDMANQDRVSSGVKQLVKNQKLEKAAGMKVIDMIENKYFAHYSPEGVSPWFFIQKAGYDFMYAGENLAINFNESKQVNDAWMASQLHRDNLLNINFEEVGVAVKEGEYNGVNTVYVVQMFGKEREPNKIETAIAAISKENKVAVNEPKNDEVKNIDDEIKIVQKGENLLVGKRLAAVENPYIVRGNDEGRAWGEVLPSEAKSDEVVGAGGRVLGLVKYTDFWENLVFNSSFYVEVGLLALCFLVLLGVLVRLFVEYERQHYRHFLYGILLLFLLISIAIFNYHLIPFF